MRNNAILFYLVLKAIVIHQCLFAQNPQSMPIGGASFISRTTYTSSSADSSYTDVTYYDGLGYPIQDVFVAAGGARQHIVQPIVYDLHRRPDSLEYLPYSRERSAPVSYDAGALLHQHAYYYANYTDSHPFGVREYEPWSGGSVLNSLRPGENWSLNDKKVYFSRGVNTASDSLVSIRYIWSPTPGVYTAASPLPAGSLFKESSIDEEGSTIVQFKNGAGKPVCIRQYDGAVRADTYFIYDVKDSLVCVIQPEGTRRLEQLTKTNGGLTLDFSDSLIADYCFTWTYDASGNVLSEHTPGGGTTEYVYDARNRPVLKADGRMRPDGDLGERRMIFTLYDQYDRIVEERYVSSPRAYLETLRTVIRDTVSHTMPSSFVESYLPTLAQLRLATYFPFTHVSADYPSVGDGAFVPESGIAETADLETTRIKGFLRQETLFPAPAVGGTIPVGAPSVTRYYHYDYRGRVIQLSECWSDGRIRRVSTKYSFTGDVLATKETVSVAVEGTGELTSSLATFYTRDPRGRVLSCSRVLNGTDTLATVHYSYDDLGRLVGKSVGNVTNPALKADYAYDLHGWATGIDVSVTDGVGSGMDTIFSETLHYATADKNQTAKRFDGNISETAFSHRIVPSSGSPYLQSNTWSYAYDGLKRLTDANHYPGAALTPSLTDTERDIAYDRNGNITTLKRYGSTGLENDLSFTHTGNRMTALSDANATGALAGTKSFSYDANGNLTHDGRKDLDLTWNLFNLVSGAVMHGSDNNTEDSSLTYAWLSDGTKVSAVAEDGNGNGVQKRYLGSFVYTSTSGSSAEPPMEVESVAWDEGRIFFNFPEVVDSMGVVDTLVGEEAVIDSLIVVDTAAVAGWFRDCWFAGDHLGNVRSVIDITSDLVAPQILEQNDYLPFGTKIQNPNLAAIPMNNRWQYACKETQRFGSLDLSLLDFGARMYDPFTARWTAVDRLAVLSEDRSPYRFCSDNPIIMIDIMGLKDTTYVPSIDKGILDLPNTATPLEINNIPNPEAYNCHSFAWESSLGDPDDKRNLKLVQKGITKWDENPDNNMSDFYQLNSNTPNVPGDRVLYYVDSNGNGAYDFGEEIVHSAVVYEVDTQGYTKTVISKRGQMGISINHPVAPLFYTHAKGYILGPKTSRAYFRYDGEDQAPSIIIP